MGVAARRQQTGSPSPPGSPWTAETKRRRGQEGPRPQPSRAGRHGQRRWGLPLPPGPSNRTGAARAPGGCWKCQGRGTSRGCCMGKDGTSKGNGGDKSSCGHCHMGGGQFPSHRDIEQDHMEGDRERDQAHSVLYSRMQACTPGLRGGPQRRQRWSPPSSPLSFSALSGYHCP